MENLHQYKGFDVSVGGAVYGDRTIFALSRIADENDFVARTIQPPGIPSDHICLPADDPEFTTILQNMGCIANGLCGTCEEVKEGVTVAVYHIFHINPDARNHMMSQKLGSDLIDDTEGISPA